MYIYSCIFIYIYTLFKSDCVHTAIKKKIHYLISLRHCKCMNIHIPVFPPFYNCLQMHFFLAVLSSIIDNIYLIWILPIINNVYCIFICIYMIFLRLAMVDYFIIYFKKTTLKAKNIWTDIRLSNCCSIKLPFY